MKRMRVAAVALAIVLAGVQALCQEARQARTYRLDSAVVRYTGIGEDYAKAIGLTAETARDVAARDFGFDMPKSIVVEVGLGERTRLFTDGQGSLHLTLKSEGDLRKPRDSGIFNIYGICHEIGHIAMYRPIKQRMWMTSPAAEGWAHYLGSRLVDVVYDKHGPGLWPDEYLYRDDGTARLKRQLARQRPGETVRAAGLWGELASIVGDKGVAPVFKAWGKAQVDPADPGDALRAALLSTKEDGRLSDWWNKAEGLFVMRRPKSEFAAATASPEQLSGKPTELANDDGASAGYQSIAGSGHAVAFEVPGDTWYLTAVRIYGSRYGTTRPPREDFHVWLCDEEFKQIADFPFPYSSFRKGSPKAVRLQVTPINVPARFVICVGFNPASTKGVYVHYDKQGSGKSFLGLPGRRGSTFDKGDWMIRAEVDEMKGTDALKGME